ncbi:ABC transporter substrate-binding protein [Actinomadura sp. GC306]|uniref:ABC transporter substrate-binding protein n=1 Tax=Actinomadura sp. GC306 TaxID=2530367 RepID=UPI0014051EAA|nr:ABC transporter substrate-binding protein [Actinomadura sp. GC306]
MTAAVAPLRAGDPSRLGAYRLTGLLGEGGQGAVFLGEDGSGHRVAVKLLHARFSGDPKARARFAAEVAVAKRVSAFCTARVLDSDVAGDRPYIVSEYIEGPSLAEVLAADGPRRGADLDRLAIGTMTALTAIHQAGVVHRDFKPGNVLLPPDGPRVIDFGIARALDATGTMSSTAVGTPAYMAPEQISGARVGPAADVFAWGTTMAYAAAGRPPFGQDSIPAVMHRILNLPPDLGELAEPLRGIVADCLSKDPALRPASWNVLAHLLDLAGGLPQPGTPPDGTEGADGADAAMLKRGAATAATETAQLRVQPPPQPPPQAPQPAQPPAGVPAPPPPGTPWPPPPPPAGGQVQAAWPGPPSFPPPGEGPGGGPRGGPRIGVLAGVGGAALVALVLAGSVIAVRLFPDGGGPGATPAGRTGGTFRMAVPSPGTPGEEIAPSHVYGGTERFVVKQLFTGLTELDADGKARNRLATRITPDRTCTRWKIGVKGGTTFSNGEPVDARAFARGWNRSAATQTGAGSYLMTDIEGFTDVAGGKADELSGVTASSGDVLDVTLTSPDCGFPGRLSEPPFMPVPEDAGGPDDRPFNTRPVGNGPYTLKEHTLGTGVSLVRNDTWAFGKTRFDGVEVTFSTDAARARTAYNAGQVDWYSGTAEEVASAPQQDLVTRPSPFTRMLVPLTARGPMKSKEARLAVSYALDRARLGTLLGGAHEPAHGIVPAAVPGFGAPGACPSCDRPDPAKAKELAGQAGLRPGAEITLHYRESPVYKHLAEAVRDALEDTLGWNVELKATPLADYDEFRESLVSKDASGLAIFAWSPDYPGAHSILWPLLGGTIVATSENTYFNYSGWKNDRFDDLMSRALRTPDAAARAGLHKQAEKLALDDMALIPLLNDGYAAVVRKDKYVGLRMDYDGDPTVAAAALR